jgi:hypothetical protein
VLGSGQNERSAIVAWLRNEVRTVREAQTDSWVYEAVRYGELHAEAAAIAALERAADLIERSEHLPPG